MDLDRTQESSMSKKQKKELEITSTKIIHMNGKRIENLNSEYMCANEFFMKALESSLLQRKIIRETFENASRPKST
jgi:ribosomal protein L14E/L6E/L27E